MARPENDRGPVPWCHADRMPIVHRWPFMGPESGSAIAVTRLGIAECPATAGPMQLRAVGSAQRLVEECLLSVLPPP
jgi:hypothetical protein